MEPVYLDNASTTRLAPEVLEAMKPYLTGEYANASSSHAMGQKAKSALEESRTKIAEYVGAKPSEIIFTSGGTESNNQALKGVLWGSDKKHLITTNIEHDCILQSASWLEKQGYAVTYLCVDETGLIDLGELEQAMTGDTALVSIIHANNEVGAIQPLKEIGNICGGKGVYLHTDACQSLTKTELNVEKQNLDLVSINAHKIHGPKGVGALYIRGGTEIKPWQHGGRHEAGLRAGTENVAGSVGFAKACEVSKPHHNKHMLELRDRLVKDILMLPDTTLNGHPTKRLCNNANIGFDKIEGEAILLRLSDLGVMVSTGSACSSHSLKSSHVLKAIGVQDHSIHGAIRFSLSRYNTKEEINYAIECVEKTVDELRKISPFT